MAPRVLIACEFSGTVRDAFRRAGCDAWSCDLLPCDGDPRWHVQGDIFEWLDASDHHWDLMIAHPDCRYLCNSGAKHLYLGTRKENGPDPARWANMAAGAAFFRKLWDAPIPRIAIENPIMLGHAQKLIGVPPTQIIQPWMHGHGETKATCLWLKNLPPLRPSNVVSGRVQRVHLMSPGPNRWKERARTFKGVADAMAAQWSPLLFAPCLA